jgi:hypothetical protein
VNGRKYEGLTLTSEGRVRGDKEAEQKTRGELCNFPSHLTFHLERPKNNKSVKFSPPKIYFILVFKSSLGISL